MNFIFLNSFIYVQGAPQNNKHLLLHGQLVKLNTVKSTCCTEHNSNLYVFR
jgi:hypothetical protein